MENRLQLRTQTVRLLEVVDDKKLEQVGGGKGIYKSSQTYTFDVSAGSN
jgi:hypothetical protein